MPKQIELTDGLFAIVDNTDFDRVSRHNWRAVRIHRSYYAKTDVVNYGKRYTISMHRMVANTPREMVCHHMNRNSLDNRQENLLNMSKKHHNLFHQMNNVLIKFEATYTGEHKRKPPRKENAR